jgi:hypothetical protein
MVVAIITIVVLYCYILGLLFIMFRVSTYRIIFLMIIMNFLTVVRVEGFFFTLLHVNLAYFLFKLELFTYIEDCRWWL